MKMGEICLGTSNHFEMMTPDGLRPVTLRCATDGTVMVEQVAGGGLTIAPMVVQVNKPEMTRWETRQIAAMEADAARRRIEE
jgi:hypothetical protein